MSVKYNSNRVITVAPSEGGAGINSAVVAVNAAGGGIVQLQAGTYVFTSTQNWTGTTNNVTIQGQGHDTILEMTVLGGGIGIQFGGTKFSNARPCTNVTRGDTSIFTTTASDAAAYLVGDRILVDIRTTDTQIRFESHRVKVAGNGTTGEIVLEKPILHSANLTTTVSGYRHGNNLVLRDFKYRQTTVSSSRLIDFNYGNDCLFEGVFFDNSTGLITQSALAMNECFDTTVKECKAEFFSGSSGLSFSTLMNCNILNNVCRFNDSGITVNTGNKVLIQGNKLEGNITSGIQILAYTTDFVINSNHCFHSGIRANNLSLDGVISNNNVVSSPAHVGIKCDSDYVNVTGNFLQFGAHGIDSQGGRKNVNFSNNTLTDCGNAGGSAINMSTVTNGLIANNAIFRSGSSPAAAISLNTTCVRVTVSGNTIDTYSSTGIDIASSTSGCVVSGNNIYNCTGDEISLANTVSGCLIVGNNVNGGTITEGTGSNTFVNNLI